MGIENRAMTVNWKKAGNESPILYRNRARVLGVEIYHWRVTAGELTEETRAAHEINIALSGSVTTRKHLATGGWRESDHPAGSLCLIPAGCAAKAAWDTEIECLRIALDPLFVNQAAMELNVSDELELIETYSRRDEIVQHLAFALLGEANATATVGRLYAESLAQTLTLHLLKNYSAARKPLENKSGGLSGYRLRRAKEYINEHLDEDLTLRRLAEAAGFSRFHFAREFRRSTGLTPQQYLTRQRIARAKELLTSGDLPLVEVAARSGFKNQSHFTTLFRKFTELTPKAYRLIKHL